MRPLLSFRDVTKTYTNVPVLRNVRFDIFEGDRIGLVGANGTGKTTLCKLVMGWERPDTGEVEGKPGIRIGYLSQYQKGDEDVTVGAELAESQTLVETRRRVEEINRQLEDPQFYSDPSYNQVMADYGELQKELAKFDGAGFSDRALDVLEALGCRRLEPEMKLRDLSGGERQKVALARIIVSTENLDMIILDEPTNHLDIDSIEWMEEYLHGFRGTVMTVSHDRYLLDDTCSRIFEIENLRLRGYVGDYTDFEEQKELISAMNRKNREKRVAEIMRQRSFIEKMKGRNRFDAQIKSKLTRLAKIKTPPDPVIMKKAITFRFQEESGGARSAIYAEGLKKAHGDSTIFSNVSFTIEYGDRIGLVGPNGAGKTTLMRLITGEDTDFEGTMERSGVLKTAYFDQGHLSLGLGNNLIEEMQSVIDNLHEHDAKALLGRFNFRGDIVYNKVDQMSGGERARVSILKMVVSPCNMLLMDEPTNHLDIQSQKSLEGALNAYKGTLVLATHDRYFLDAVATKIFVMRGGKLRVFPGGYTRYRSQIMEETGVG